VVARGSAAERVAFCETRRRSGADGEGQASGLEVTQTPRIVQALSRVEIEGRSIAFEYGLLLRHRAASGPVESWHVTLLRVSVADMLWAENRPKPECELLAETQRGEKLSGCASLVGSASAPDSLRLVGSSALRAG
jgi:hypothetical protein